MSALTTETPMTEETTAADEAFDLVIGDLEAEMPVTTPANMTGPYPTCFPGAYCLP